MAPILAEWDLGDLAVTVYAYTTFLVVAAIVAGALLVRAMGRLGVSRRGAIASCGLAVVAGLAGARLASVVFEAKTYLADPGSIFALQARGFALYGGLAAGAAAMLLAARRWRIAGWHLGDASLPAVAAGIALVRVGCFLNGCCPGLPTDLPWGVHYAFGSTAWSGQLLTGVGGFLGLAGHVEPVHPTQLYEAAAALACLGLALVIRRRAVAPGTAALVFATGFLAFRVVNQTLRQPTPGASVTAEATLLLDVAVAAAATVLLIWRWRLPNEMSVATRPAFA